MKKRGNFLFFIFVVLLIIYFLRDVNFYELFILINELNLFYFCLAFFSCLISYFIWNLRFKYSLSTIIKIKDNFFFLLGVLFSGVFINTITPGTSVGGEPVRAYFLSKKYNKPKSNFFGVVLADKFIHVFPFIVFFIFSLLFLSFFLEVGGIVDKILRSVIFLFVFILLLILFLNKIKKLNVDFILKIIFRVLKLDKKFKTFKAFKKYLDKRYNNFYLSFKKVFAHKRIFLIGIFLSLLFWLFFYLVPYFLFLSLGINVSFFIIIIAVTISHLIGDLSPSPGGIGLVEGIMFVVYSSMGITPSAALAVSLLNRLIFYFFNLIIGGLSFFYLKNK